MTMSNRCHLDNSFKYNKDIDRSTIYIFNNEQQIRSLIHNYRTKGEYITF